MKTQTGQVVYNRHLTKDIFELGLKVPEPLEVSPGQFCNLTVANSTAHDPLLPRPISICDYDPDTQVIRFVIRIVGRGTEALSQQEPGCQVEILGPLGHGFPSDGSEGSALMLGGGVGIPPLLYLAKKLSTQGISVTAILGFRSRAEAFLLEEFSRYAKVQLCTDDGSAGQKGNVCTLMQDRSDDDWSVAYACGPLPMLRGIEEIFSGETRPVYVSVERRMACGLGACTACTCKSKKPQNEQDWYRLACTDGPVFALGEVELGE